MSHEEAVRTISNLLAAGYRPDEIQDMIPEAQRMLAEEGI